jgi:hypothetical protein
VEEAVADEEVLLVLLEVVEDLLDVVELLELVVEDLLEVVELLELVLLLELLEVVELLELVLLLELLDVIELLELLLEDLLMDVAKYCQYCILWRQLWGNGENDEEKGDWNIRYDEVLLLVILEDLLVDEVVLEVDDTLVLDPEVMVDDGLDTGYWLLDEELSLVLVEVSLVEVEVSLVLVAKNRQYVQNQDVPTFYEALTLIWISENILVG